MIRLCAFSDEAASDTDGQIAALHRNRISLVELRGADGLNIADMPEEKARAVADKFRKSGIGVWSIGSPLGKSDIAGDFGEVERTARALFALAQYAECANVRVFSFYNALSNGGEVKRRLRALVGIAAGYGVTLCHENEKDIYGDAVSRVSELLDGVEGLASVFDPANYAQVGEDPAAALGVLRGRTKYYHIKDVAPDGSLVPAGEGIGGIDALIAGIDRDAVLTLEPHLRVFDGYAAIDRSEMKHVKTYASGGEAFDAAANALKSLLQKNGYRETFVKGGYIWKRD